MSLRDLAHVAAEGDAALQSATVAESQTRAVKLPSLFAPPQLVYPPPRGLSYLLPAHYSINGPPAALDLVPLSSFAYPPSHPSAPMAVALDKLSQNAYEPSQSLSSPSRPPRSSILQFGTRTWRLHMPELMSLDFMSSLA